jgi:hypothetical protein
LLFATTAMLFVGIAHGVRADLALNLHQSLFTIGVAAAMATGILAATVSRYTPIARDADYASTRRSALHSHVVSAPSRFSPAAIAANRLRTFAPSLNCLDLPTGGRLKIGMC